VKLIVLTQFVCIVFLVISFNVIVRLSLKAAQLGRYAEMQLGSVFHVMNWLFLGVTVISIIVGAILSLRLSHRFIGPLYRIESTIKEALAENKRLELRVRSDDELHDLVNLVNEYVEKNLKNDKI
jgi:methyl-accepting chemotaxis protein